MSCVMTKPAFAYAKTKVQISCSVSNRATDQRICFHYNESAISLLPKSEIFSL